MKNKSSGAVWGIILVFFGLMIAGKSLNLFHFSIFFNGWWTLFIIIPCFIKLCNGGREKRTSNIIGLCIGVFLLLSSQGMMPWNLFAPLLIAAVFVLIGVKMVFGDNQKNNNDDTTYDSRTKYYQEDVWTEQDQDDYFSGNNTQFGAQSSYQYTDSEAYHENDYNVNLDNQDNFNKNNYNQNQSYNQSQGYNQNQSYTQNNQNQSNNQNYNQSQSYSQNQSNYDFNTMGNDQRGRERVACSAIFSGKSLKFDQEIFNGAMFSVIFGGIDLDLRRAIIRNDVTIEAKVIFGGMDILVPDYVRVVVDGTSILGGVDNKVKSPSRTNEYIPTIYINSTCVFGGMDVK